MLATLTLIEAEIEVAEHLGLARKAARKFADSKIPVMDSEEYSVACIALVEAARNYKPADGEFSTVAYRQMKQAIIDSYRYSQRRKRKGSFDRGANLEEIEAKESTEPLPDDLLFQLLVDHANESAQDRSDKLLLIEVYLGGNKVPDIAERLCVSRQTIYNRIERCLTTIRQRHPDLLERYQEAFQ